MKVLRNITVELNGKIMNNKTLATINVICICLPMLLGVIEEVSGSPANQLLLGIFGLCMIIFGIWTSVRLSKQPD